MGTQNQKPSLSEVAKNLLLDFAPDVSRADKKGASEELRCDLITVNRYLKGDIRDIGTAEKLIAYLRPIIQKRRSTIAA